MKYQPDKGKSSLTKHPLLATISYYKSFNEKAGVDITIGDFLNGVRNGPEWKIQTEYVRDGPSKGENKTEYDQRKKLANCVTISGTFEDDKSANSLQSHSGFIAMDFDELSDVDQVRNTLNADRYTFACFASIGGKGLCVLNRIQPDRFADAFAALEQHYLNTYGLVVDAACKNVNRLRYVSHDPAIYVNEDAPIWKSYLPEKERKRLTIGQYIHTDNDLNHILQQFENRQVELHDSTGDWVRIGLALANKYGPDGSEYFHRLSQTRHDYDPDYTGKRYAYFCQIQNGSVTIATFYHLAKQAGFDIMTPRTRDVVSLATSSKSNKVAIESAIDGILKMTDYTEAEARPIVEQVYASSQKIDTDETIYQQASTFIKQKRLRFNIIRRRFVDSEEIELDEWGLNNLYIECLNLFDGKLKRPDFETLMRSDTIPTYNPLKAFLMRHRHLQPAGLIDALADTVETDTGLGDGARLSEVSRVDDVGTGLGDVTNFDPTYFRFFLRKVLIGLIANIHADKDVCSLMLVFTGKQGTGKTEWFRRLLPDELQPYYAETKFEAGKDDEILMTQKLIMMNDELEGLTVHDARKLKSLTSKRIFTVREVFGRHSVDLLRLAILCGTSNPREVINDPTGNRRIVPVNVLKIDHAAYNRIDKTAVLMEAFHAWKSGERHTLTSSDIARLNKWTNSFQQHTIERQLLDQYVGKPAGTGGENIQLLSAMQIMVYLETKANNRKLSDRKISHELGAMEFEKGQKRINGERIRAYQVVLLE